VALQHGQQRAHRAAHAARAARADEAATRVDRAAAGRAAADCRAGRAALRRNARAARRAAALAARAAGAPLRRVEVADRLARDRAANALGGAAIRGVRGGRGGLVELRLFDLIAVGRPTRACQGGFGRLLPLRRSDRRSHYDATISLETGRVVPSHSDATTIRLSRARAAGARVEMGRAPRHDKQRASMSIGGGPFTASSCVME